MLKTLMLSITILSALLCLGGCGNSEPSEYSENSLIMQCQEHLSKPLVAEEIEEVAVLTNSKGQTHIHLDGIVGYCASNIKIRTSCTADTLNLKEYWPSEGRANASCSCILSLDLTIESIGDDIKYLVYTYTKESGLSSKIFPVRYE